MEPNSLFIDYDGKINIGDTVADTPTITLTTPSGKELSLNLSGDTIDISGDADVTEAAQVFFDEVIKICNKKP